MELTFEKFYQEAQRLQESIVHLRQMGLEHQSQQFPQPPQQHQLPQQPQVDCCSGFCRMFIYMRV